MESHSKVTKTFRLQVVQTKTNDETFSHSKRSWLIKIGDFTILQSII